MPISSSVHQWMLGFLKDLPLAALYDALADRITEAMGFMRACGINPDTARNCARPISSPATRPCCLAIEQAMTRVDSTTGDWYATSAHMLWIGDRTRQPDHAHVEFFRGVKNPIGIKCGPSLKADELLRLIDLLNPDNEPGRLTLICRFGADKVEKHLPELVRAVKREGRRSCGPAIRCMATPSRRPAATRRGRFDAILSRGAPLHGASTPPRAPMPAASISR